MASSTLLVPMKASPSPSFSASTHQRCQRKLWRRRVPKSEMRRSGSARSRSTFVPQLRLGARIEDVEREAAHALQRRARAQLVDDGERRDLPHRGVRPRPGEFAARTGRPRRVSSYSGSWKSASQARNSGREDLPAAVEGVAGEPDQLLLGEAQGARMVELVAQLLLVDLVGEPDALGAVDQREGRLHVRVEAPDHLQHQQLVEIGVEQAADDRIELPGVVVDPLGDVGDGHAAVLAD